MNYFRPIQNKVKHAAQVEVIDIEARDIDGKLEVLVEEEIVRNWGWNIVSLMPENCCHAKLWNLTHRTSFPSKRNLFSSCL